MKDTTAYKIFHDIDFNKFPLSLLRPLKTHLYPITSLFVVETPYAKFYLDDMVKVTNVDEYCLDDLRPDDIVLDIGACIGGFSLKVHNQVKMVFAIEPIMINRLRRNLILNDTYNIGATDCALGNWDIKEINWSGYTKRVVTYPLSKIITICNRNIDFLKLDAEGAEYCIKPEELKGIRRIEAEVHRTEEHKCSDFLDVLTEAGFEYKANYILSDELMIVHAWSKKDCVLLNMYGDGEKFLSPVWFSCGKCKKCDRIPMQENQDNRFVCRIVG